MAARCETSVGAFTPTDRSQPGKIFNNQSDMIRHIRDGCALRPVELRCAGTARKWRFWTVRTQCVRTWSFPLHSCRGLIEAKKALIAKDLAWQVFPCIRAGASLKLGSVTLVGDALAVFPCIRAGASLKRAQAVWRSASARSFPLHSCRGLIEAATERGSASAATTFSPAFVQGPH